MRGRRAGGSNKTRTAQHSSCSALLLAASPITFIIHPFGIYRSTVTVQRDPGKVQLLLFYQAHLSCVPLSLNNPSPFYRFLMATWLTRRVPTSYRYRFPLDSLNLTPKTQVARHADMKGKKTQRHIAFVQHPALLSRKYKNRCKIPWKRFIQIIACSKSFLTTLK